MPLNWRVAITLVVSVSFTYAETPNNTLVVTAYNTLSELYVDGLTQEIPNGGNWNTADYIPLQLDSRLLALKATNLGNPMCGGVLASVINENLLTDSSWKCTVSNAANWSSLGFDDSAWPNAVEYGDNANGQTNCPQNQDVIGISPNAKWIWSSNIFDFSIYCRGYTPFCETSSPCLNNGTCLQNDPNVCACLPQFTGTLCETELVNGTLVITAYNTLTELYIDGVTTTIPNGGTWNTADYIPLPSDSRLIALRATNLGNPTCGGVLASVVNDNLLTDSSWKCYQSNPDNWSNLGYDDSGWPNATEYGDNANGHMNCSQNQDVIGISPNAKWIWSSNLLMDVVIYCRGYSPFCETSSPCLNNGTCLQKDQNKCACLPQFTGTFCETELVAGTLVITAYAQLSELYVDGLTQEIPNGGTWNAADYIPLPSDGRLVALRARNLANPLCGGVLASVVNHSLLTDSSWKCATSNPANWSSLGFDDSGWLNAVEYGDNANGHMNCSQNQDVIGINPDAKWIWTSNPLVFEIYCRGYTPFCETSSPCLNNGICLENDPNKCACLLQFTGVFCETELVAGTLVITAYNALSELYIDGLTQEIPNGGTWNTADYIPLPSDGRLVALMAKNLANPLCSGVLASVINQSLLTDSSWKCTIYNAANWSSLGFDDSGWLNAVEYGDNANGHMNCSQNQDVIGISPGAKWIWTRNLLDFVIYCRGYTPFCETSSPCFNKGTCIQNGQNFCACLPQYTGEFCETEIPTTTEVTTMETTAIVTTLERLETTDGLAQSELVITAKSFLNELYVDGEPVTLTNGYNWTEVDEFILHPFNRLISVKASDFTSTCAGILASVTNDFLVTDSGWKCQIGAPEGWFSLGFDDSEWKPAYPLGLNYNVTWLESCEILTGVSSISPKAYWIWTDSITERPYYDQIIYCRAYTPVCESLVPCQNGGTCNKNNVTLCSCPPEFTGTYCEFALQKVLTITAKSTLYELYIDGAAVTLTNGDNASIPDAIPLPSYTRLIGAIAIDTTSTCGGLLASVTGDYLVTDSTWKCEADVPPQWNELGFDDSSWSHAQVIGPNHNVTWPEECSILKGVDSISENAYWIWTPSIQNTPTYDDIIYCRAYIPTCVRDSPCQNGGTCNNNSATICSCRPEYSGNFCEYEVDRVLTITAKSTIYQLYIDGEQQNLIHGNNWTLVDNITLSSTSRLIGVLAVDSTQTCAGILASVTDDYLVSDVTWRCHVCAPPQWYVLGFDDSGWDDTYVIGPNANVTWPESCEVLTEISGISQNANWIWTSTIPDTPFYDQIIYCRAYLPVCERQEPCQNGGTCNSNSVVLCTCPSGFTGVYCESGSMENEDL